MKCTTPVEVLVRQLAHSHHKCVRYNAFLVASVNQVLCARATKQAVHAYQRHNARITPVLIQMQNIPSAVLIVRATVMTCEILVDH
jgi:hypothetical protein